MKVAEEKTRQIRAAYEAAARCARHEMKARNCRTVHRMTALDRSFDSSADFARLGEEVEAVLAAGADLIHFDVMDNHYVPNLTIGPLVCEALRKHGITAPIDVHLMVKPVDRIIPDFAQAGATWITFHPEASEHVDRTIELIREHGCRPGLVFNPATPLDWLDHVIDKLDMVLLMSVNPGFGGQKFIPSALAKLRAARETHPTPAAARSGWRSTAA